MNAPGKGLLKVISILFIIFGVIATIMSVLALIGSAAVTAYLGELGIILVIATAVMLIASVLELVMGILGLKKCGGPCESWFLHYHRYHTLHTDTGQHDNEHRKRWLLGNQPDRICTAGTLYWGWQYEQKGIRDSWLKPTASGLYPNCSNIQKCPYKGAFALLHSAIPAGKILSYRPGFL